MISHASFTNPDRVVSALGLSAPNSDWQREWAKSMESFTPEVAAICDPAIIARNAQSIRVPDPAIEALVKAAGIFNKYPALKPLAWHYHRVLFHEPIPENFVMDWQYFPRPDETLCAGGSLFAALVFLSGVPMVRARHQALGIPESVTLDTLWELPRYLLEYKKEFKRWGFNQWIWAFYGFSGELYRLGRLEFCFEAFRYDLHGYRRKADGGVVLMAGDGSVFRDDGQFADADMTTDPHPWKATFCDDGKLIVGYPISSDGGAIKCARAIRTNQCEKILQKDDRVLAIHIPDGAPLDEQACRKSMTQALEFFPKHFPDRPFKAFVCASWLLDAQFAELLPEQSNIRKFMMKFYLHPLPGARIGPGLLSPVFGPGRLPDEENIPQDTSLQRVMLKHVRDGKKLRPGAGVIFPEDLR